ncbi:MAG: hypothetical protein F6J93_00520 [Oscillatoria sp. SIO1A7]|nr:hypothetical protein [Oscillatoria sp. SIO1A7]
MLKRFSILAVSSYIALLSALAPALFLPEVARAEDEVKKCEPEPTDMTITYGDRITCGLHGGGDSDIFRLEGTAGDRIIFGLSASISKQVEVIDPSGNTLDKRGGKGVRYELTLKETGTYTFIVTPNTSTGSYLIEVSCVIGSCLSSQN